MNFELVTLFCGVAMESDVGPSLKSGKIRMSKTWMETNSGRRLDLLNPDPDQIEIDDIAHHLGILPRFNGATRFPYSVAQHSLYVSMLVPDHLKLPALLHDAHEAYIGDLSTPLKNCLVEGVAGGWSDPVGVIIGDIDLAIRMRFSLETLDGFGYYEIKRADMQAMSDERAFLKPNSTSSWEEYGLPPPAGGINVVLSWHEAKQAFLQQFWKLYERRPSIQSNSRPHVEPSRLQGQGLRF